MLPDWTPLPNTTESMKHEPTTPSADPGDISSIKDGTELEVEFLPLVFSALPNPTS
jgi:hypothetical protein